MKALADMGMKQGVLAPHERPHVPMLRRLGFTGDDISVVAQAMRHSPELLSSLSSASPMWTANAATVSPSADSQDERVHFTAANLNNKFHRSIEAETTSQVLQAIFKMNVTLYTTKHCHKWLCLVTKVQPITIV